MADDVEHRGPDADAADAQSDGRDTHVLDRGVGEETLVVVRAAQEERADRERQHADDEQHGADPREDLRGGENPIDAQHGQEAGIDKPRGDERRGGRRRGEVGIDAHGVEREKLDLAAVSAEDQQEGGLQVEGVAARGRGGDRFVGKRFAFGGGGQQQDAQVKQQAMQIQQLAQQLKDSKIREAQLREQVAKSEPSTETGSLQKIAGAAASANTEPERATAMLTLAMQLHDQYVDKGKAKAKEITEESQRKYEEIIGSANDYSNRTRSEADQYSTDTRANADNYLSGKTQDGDAYLAQKQQDGDAYLNQKTEEGDAYLAQKTEEGNAYLAGKQQDGDAYLEQKQQEGDAYFAQKQEEGDGYLAQKTQDADTYFSDKHTEADNYEAEVQKRAFDYDSKTRTAADDYAQQVRDNLETQTKVIEGNIKGLKQFETEYRARLTDFLGQLVNQVSDTNNYDQDPQDNND